MKKPKFEIFVGKDGKYYYRLKAANGEPIMSGRGYATKPGIIHSIANVISESGEELRFTRLGEPTQILTRGGPGYAGKSRVPGGHPEGFLEAFASIYADAADAIAAGALPEGLPGVEEGVQGLRFIDACLRSNADDGRWTQVEE